MIARGMACVMAVAACGPRPPPPPPPRPTPPPIPAPVAPPPPMTSAPPVSIPAAPTETDVFMQLGAYTPRFDDVFGSSLGTQPVHLAAYRTSKPIAFDVFHHVGDISPVLVTVGLARREQPHAHGETPRYVELLAEPSKASDNVAAVLAHLGRWMHDPERSIDVRFRAFEPLRLEAPLFEMEHFVLVPAVTARIGDRDVTILRVIPAVPDEFAHIKMRGDGAARAWWHERRGDKRLSKRWSSAL